MGLVSFLFGKKPKIHFTKEGSVRHELPESKWQAWKDRFAQDPNFNWRNHDGKAGKKKKRTLF